MITKEKLIEAGVDLDTIRDVVNGAANLNGNGNVVSRLGTSLKTIARILATIENNGNTLIATKTSEINTLLAEIESDADFLVNDSNNRITASINNAYAQVVTGGAPILSSESAAQLPAIEAASVTDRQIVNLKGWHTANDGGALLLIYDAASTAAVNGGTVFPGPGGSLSFDGITGAFNGTPGTGRYLSLETRRLKPEQFGAKGDGVTDDQPALQRCVNYGVSVPNCKIELNPIVSYGLSSTLVIPPSVNNIEIYGSMGEISGAPPTFVKLANVLALDIQGQHYLHSLKIRGRGDQNPALTDPSVESTPAIVIGARARLDLVSVSHCGGLHYGTERGTDGYAIGIVQLEAANCNRSELNRLNITACKGGVYIGKYGPININAIKVHVTNISNCTGVGINADSGFKNHFEVQHCSLLTEAVFRIDYVENYAYCQYAETGIPTGVIFGTSAARNTVEFLSGLAFTNIYTGRVNNTWIDRQSRAVYGIQSRGDLDGDYGIAFEVGPAGVTGQATWLERIAEVAAFGMLVNITIKLRGTKLEASDIAARLVWDQTIFPFAPFQAVQAIYPALLTNSTGSSVVYLMHETVSRMRIYNANMQTINFDQVCGTGEFTLAASISIQRRY